MIVYKITLRQVLNVSHLWYINLASIAACEILPAFELFHFGKHEFGVIDVLKATLFFNILFSTVTASYKLLGKELGDRIALTLFTKPISFQRIIFEKFLALVTSIAIIALVQGLWIMKQGWILDWPTQTMLLALLNIWNVFLQGLTLLSVCVLLTIWIGAWGGLVGTFLVFYISYSIPYDWIFITGAIIPALPNFEMSSLLYSQKDFSIMFPIAFTCYGICYTVFILYVSAWALERKEF